MSDKTVPYPLGHSSDESKRLDEQAKLLEHRSLATLVASASHCLELGCGVGSNLETIAKANPAIRYTGIDREEKALGEAKAKAEGLGLSSTFTKADAHQLPFADASFDLVFAKLVLWSVGPRWEQVIAEAHRVLRPGGVLYLFEPDDRMLVFSPTKNGFQGVIARWQERRRAEGLDPFIGMKLHGALVRAGLTNVEVHPFSKVSSGTDAVQYRAHLENLRRIFMGKGAEALGLAPSVEPWLSAVKEGQTFGPEDYLVETHFIAVARKK